MHAEVGALTSGIVSLGSTACPANAYMHDEWSSTNPDQVDPQPKFYKNGTPESSSIGAYELARRVVRRRVPPMHSTSFSFTTLLLHWRKMT